MGSADGKWKTSSDAGATPHADSAQETVRHLVRNDAMLNAPGPNPPWYPKMRATRLVRLHNFLGWLDDRLGHPSYRFCGLVTHEWWRWETYAYGNIDQDRSTTDH